MLLLLPPLSLSLQPLPLCSRLVLCSQCCSGHLSPALVLPAPWAKHSLLNQTVLVTVPAAPSAGEAIAPSLPSTAALGRVEGTETSPSTEAWLLWQLLPEEDIVFSSEWLPFQICTARQAKLGCSGSSSSARQARAAHP